MLVAKRRSSSSRLLRDICVYSKNISSGMLEYQNDLRKCIIKTNEILEESESLSHSQVKFLNDIKKNLPDSDIPLIDNLINRHSPRD